MSGRRSRDAESDGYEDFAAHIIFAIEEAPYDYQGRDEHRFDACDCLSPVNQPMRKQDVRVTNIRNSIAPELCSSYRPIPSRVRKAKPRRQVGAVQLDAARSAGCPSIRRATTIITAHELCQFNAAGPRKHLSGDAMLVVGDALRAE